MVGKLVTRFPKIAEMPAQQGNGHVVLITSIGLKLDKITIKQKKKRQEDKWFHFHAATPSPFRVETPLPAATPPPPAPFWEGERGKGSRLERGSQLVDFSDCGQFGHGKTTSRDPVSSQDPLPLLTCLPHSTAGGASLFQKWFQRGPLRAGGGIPSSTVSLRVFQPLVEKVEKKGSKRSRKQPSFDIFHHF